MPTCLSLSERFLIAPWSDLVGGKQTLKATYTGMCDRREYRLFNATICKSSENNFENSRALGRRNEMWTSKRNHTNNNQISTTCLAIAGLRLVGVSSLQGHDGGALQLNEVRQFPACIFRSDFCGRVGRMGGPQIIPTIMWFMRSCVLSFVYGMRPGAVTQDVFGICLQLLSHDA